MMSERIWRSEIARMKADEGLVRRRSKADFPGNVMQSEFVDADFMFS